MEVKNSFPSENMKGKKMCNGQISHTSKVLVEH